MGALPCLEARISATEDGVIEIRVQLLLQDDVAQVHVLHILSGPHNLPFNLHPKGVVIQVTIL